MDRFFKRGQPAVDPTFKSRFGTTRGGQPVCLSRAPSDDIAPWIGRLYVTVVDLPPDYQLDCSLLNDVAVIRIQLSPLDDAGVARLVQLFDPFPGLVQVGGARGDDDQAVEPLHRQHSQGAVQRKVGGQHRFAAHQGRADLKIQAIEDFDARIVAPALAMLPAGGQERREALKVCALATGLADKAVSLVYEAKVHDRSTAAWVERCRSQISGALRELEASRIAHKTDWWFGPSIGHADIAAACALRFLGDAHPQLFDLAEGWPILAAHVARCEALDVFNEIQQPFKVMPLQ